MASPPAAAAPAPPTLVPVVILALAVTTVALTALRRRRKRSLSTAGLFKIASPEKVAAVTAAAAVATPEKPAPATSSSATSAAAPAVLSARDADFHGGTPTVFFDLDGTLVSSEMQHAIFYFIHNLPARHQRLARQVFFLPMIISVALVNIFSADWAIKILAYYALHGVTAADAEHAAKHGVQEKLLQWVRPELYHELNEHKRAGRVVAILTGNLEPLVAPLANHLGCVCFSTGIECVTTAEGQAVYSGYLQGQPLLHTQKSMTVESLSKGMDRHQLYGYGNSKHDVDFLNILGHPHAVYPDRQLLAHSQRNNWTVLSRRSSSSSISDEQSAEN